MRRRRRGGEGAVTVGLPARRAACRPRGAALEEAGRMYVAGWEDEGQVVVDVIDDRGVLSAHWVCGDEGALAVALLSDATGHRPMEATTAAFRREVIALLPRDAFAISSQEVCAWLLIRAIERLER